ncbi:MAG: GDSL-type esterase/lipase family protein [Puniceicoccales bacterium]
MISIPRSIFWLSIFLGLASQSIAEVGQDVAAVFQRAKEGAPLRYVALGGSITQSGKGWVGDWLKEEFPESQVMVVNSGMSATGSALGVFRVGRDVIDYQPDLVAIEYCVNDGGLSDEDAIRNMESLVVRLKSLPNPPAIVILEAAAKGGVNLSRHRKVAEHYGLLEVDFQKAVDEELEETGAEWSLFFGDSVHPNQEGNAFYREVMVKALEPYLEMEVDDVAVSLPRPLSRKPLVLDGRIVPISTLANEPGWEVQNSLPFWWDKFFRGVLHAEKPGTSLTIPFRGSRVGLFVAMDRSYGSFYASVDGGVPEHIFTNTRGGYLHRVLAQDLAAQEHELTIVLPEESDPALKMNGSVNLGYLLIAGEEGAGERRSEMGPFSPKVIQELNFEKIVMDGWEWSGPCRLETEAPDALPFLDVAFPAETNPAEVEWMSVDWQGGGNLDLATLAGSTAPSIVYLRGKVFREQGGPVLLAVQVDYFAKIWINGELVANIDAGHGSPSSFVYVPAILNPGENQLTVKVGAGSQGHWVALALTEIDPSVEVSTFMKGRDMNEGNTEGSPEPTWSNIPYGVDERNVMDVWLADSAVPTPTVVYIHGGGWLGGDKSKTPSPLPFLQEGISYIAINYRFLPQTIIDTGSERGTGAIQPRGDYPDPPVAVPLYDAARAIQFIRSNAKEWNLDPDRIGLTGGSAGACTSLWLTFHDDLADPDAEDPVSRESTRVWCAAVEGAQTTLDPVQILEWMPNATYGGHAFGYVWDQSDYTVEIRSFLADRENVTEWIAEYSPYELVTSDDPPVYLFYRDTPKKGEEKKDATHSANYGALLSEKLDELGVEYEFVHGGVESPRYESINQYLIEVLKN